MPIHTHSFTHTHLQYFCHSQVLVFAWVFILMARIVGVFQRPAAATAIGVVLCVATVGVFVAAVALANIDRLNEKRAEQPDSNTASGVELTTMRTAAVKLITKAPKNETTDDKEPEEVEAGLSQGRESPVNEEKAEQLDANPSSTLPWSAILSIGRGTLCGTESTEDDSTSVPTAQASFEKLASLAIAAGVDRSEVSQLAQNFSKQLPLSPD